MMASFEASFSWISRTGFCVGVSAILAAGHIARGQAHFGIDDFENVEKIDSHIHIKTWETAFVSQAKAIGMKFVNIAVYSKDPAEMHLRHETGFHQQEANPRFLTMIASFPLKSWNEPQWVPDTLSYIDKASERGALGIKIWKNIGMEFRGGGDSLIMIDHPKFRPIIEHISKRGLVLIGHLGEPKNCWLPLEQMTVKNDRNYFKRHPEYHMFLHPELPSYEQQIAARDRMISMHPNLKFIGAHFASLEWSVVELGKFLQRFPNAHVDTAARMGQLQHQSQKDYQQVRDFIIAHQDRILYGTDLTISAPTPPEAAYANALRRWKRDWLYFCTDKMITVPELNTPVKGLSLPRDVVEKIYSKNVKTLFPSLGTAPPSK